MPIPPTKHQIDWARRQGFRFSTERGTVLFEAFVDKRGDLGEGERYTRDGWRSAPGAGYRLARVAVFHDPGREDDHCNVSLMTRGKGKVRNAGTMRAAFEQALKHLEGLRRFDQRFDNR